MNTQQVLILSLREFLRMGEMLLADLGNSRLAFEFLDNASKIKKYIFEKHYHDALFRQYYHDLPDVDPEELGKISETTIEKVLNISERVNFLIDLIGTSPLNKREENRNKLMLLVSKMTSRTRTLLQKIDLEI